MNTTSDKPKAEKWAQVPCKLITLAHQWKKNTRKIRVERAENCANDGRGDVVDLFVREQSQIEGDLSRQMRSRRHCSRGVPSPNS